MPVTLEEKLADRLSHSIHHREQLDAIAVDMADMMGVDMGSVAHRNLRAAVYGEIDLSEALRRVVNAKLAELAAIEVEGVE
jgi:hypothetical protein